MSSHRLTPYELTATRKWARGEKKNQALLLASLSSELTVDLLDVVERHLLNVEPVSNSSSSKTIRPAAVERDGDFLHMVLAVDVSGEREVVYSGGGERVLYLKGREDVARLFACASFYRPPAGDRGVLLLHSPWSRGGNRSNVGTILQRCVDAEAGVKAKLSLSPMVPAKSVERFLRQAEATRIVYTKRKGIRSSFNNRTESAQAEMDLIVKGSDSRPYRDALRGALRAVGDRSEFFTVRVRDDEGGFSEEHFDDVAIDLQTSGGRKRYSLAEGNMPTVSFDLTAEINKIYFSLPEDKPSSWGDLLLAEAKPHLRRIIEGVYRDAT